MPSASFGSFLSALNFSSPPVFVQSCGIRFNAHRESVHELLTLHHA
jgi:hypothetical protein